MMAAVVPSRNKANQPFIGGHVKYLMLILTYLLPNTELFYWYFSRILLKSKVIIIFIVPILGATINKEHLSGYFRNSILDVAGFLETLLINK